MAKSNLIAGLDIGTGHIKLLVVKQKEDQPGFEVVSQLKETSFGVRKGVVIDTEKVSRIIQILLNRAREETGQKINAVFTNIGGSHLSCVSSRGMIAVSRADQKISEMDVARVIESAKTVSLPSNSQIMEVYPKEFIVDNNDGVKEAIGMHGGRLEVETMVLACFTPYLNNLTQAILASDLRILDVVPSSLASAEAVLTPKQKELGAAILDIGAGTSELAIFEEGELVHLVVFPMGSANITNDIAIGLKTDIDTAEVIKIEKGSCSFKGSDKKEKVEVEGEDTLIFSQKMLSRIIEARVSEIFGEVQKELKKIQKQGMLPAGIVLTGGGSRTPKIVDLAKKELKLPCRIGKPMDFYGLEEDLNYATSCGLIMRGMRGSNRSLSISSSNWTEKTKFVDRFKKILKVFIP
ncbi:MAG: cell division protein FtsA [bacterium]